MVSPEPMSPVLQQVAEEVVVQLPYEHLAREAIKNGLKAEFHLAEEVFDLAIGLFAEKIPMNPGPGLDDDVIVTVLGLLAKSCKQYRAIVLLVERGSMRLPAATLGCSSRRWPRRHSSHVTGLF